MMKQMILVAAVAMAWPEAAGAQPPGGEEPFTGAYAGPEIGLHEHHFFIEETDLGTNATTGRYYRGWGIGGGAFGGFDVAVHRRIRVGGEVGISLGGENPEARFSDGTTYTLRPRYGYRATGKVGYLLNDRLMAYGTLGYGGHTYRLGGTAFVRDGRESGSSFTIGAGVQYRLRPGIDVRLDFRHLDNQMSHLLIGIPFRF